MQPDETTKRTFEQWARSLGLNLRHDSTHYRFTPTAVGWEAWKTQAAHTARLEEALASMVSAFQPRTPQEIDAHYKAVMLLAENLSAHQASAAPAGGTPETRRDA